MMNLTIREEILKGIEAVEETIKSEIRKEAIKAKDYNGKESLNLYIEVDKKHIKVNESIVFVDKKSDLRTGLSIMKLKDIYEIIYYSLEDVKEILKVKGYKNARVEIKEKLGRTNHILNGGFKLNDYYEGF